MVKAPSIPVVVYVDTKVSDNTTTAREESIDIDRVEIDPILNDPFTPLFLRTLRIL